MKCDNKKLNRFILFSHCVILCLHLQYSFGCTFKDGNYDLSALEGSWPVVSLKNGTKVVQYDISLCSSLDYSNSPGKESCANSSICRHIDGNATSMGNDISVDKSYVIYDNPSSNGFSMFLKSSLCRTKNNNMNTAMINFICGKNLGSPKLVMQSDCSVYFSWVTSAACKKKQKRREVPCYVIDAQGNKRDLTNLIQEKGGYHVQSNNPAMEFIINVCSDITPDGHSEKCPSNSSACKIIGNRYLSYGEPQKGLQMVEGEGLMLTYETRGKNPNSGCNVPPKTTVLFRCPQRGQYHYPKLISDVDCHYEVEWDTEHACPETMLKGNIKNCQFSAETHGVDIDLSPLRIKDVYTVTGNVSGNTSIFTFSVCGGLENATDCGNLGSAVCLKNSVTNVSEIVGITKDATLNYIDGDIFLVYEGGKACSLETRSKTIINFHCNKTAVLDGQGKPEYISSVDDCVHFIKWETKYACPEESSEISCSAVLYGQSIFDLSVLKKEKDEEPWLALDEMHLEDRERNSSYYINICGAIPKTRKLSGCESGAAVCMIDNGTYRSLGKFTSPPVYNSITKTVRLEYKSGSPCQSNNTWKSIIEFSCKPGLITSSPILVNINNVDCTYEFQWHSARACPITTINGDNCRVTDLNLGIDYDLSPLKAEDHEIVTDGYVFHLSVCSPLPQTSCGFTQNNASLNVGACQVENSNKNSKLSWKIGEANSHLTYSDGVVNLTYIAGDPYNDQNKTPRKTVILFMCDVKAGKGKPIFVEEVEFAYVFHWYTSLICTESAFTECTAYDSRTHEIYDLSSLSKYDENWVLFVEDFDNEKKKAYINVCRYMVPTVNCASNAAACLVNITSGTETPYIPNIGRALNKPEFMSEGHLRLSYDHGQACDTFENNVNYSSVIHFLCSKGLQYDGPSYIGKLGDCQYTFTWPTMAACPTGRILVRNECSLTDPYTGFIFDFSTLNKDSPYTILAGKRKFQINVCGSVKNGCHLPSDQTGAVNVSACEIDKDNAVSVLGTADGYSLQYFPGSNIVLKYKNETSTENGRASEVIISFPCDSTASEVKPVFVKEEKDGKYFFEIRTPLTCIIEKQTCAFVDQKGNKYDLNPLSRKASLNWEVADSSPKHRTVKYHINFCRPLNKVTKYSCPGGATAACETDSNTGESFSLGSQYNPPKVSGIGIVTLFYTEGSPCPNNLKRSTRINLICSDNQGELIFIGKTPECEYLFSLHTPSACPRHFVKGYNCIVSDPLYGYGFNLKPLQNVSANYSTAVGEYIYHFNVCDKLGGFSGVCENSSVCQTKTKDPSFSKSLGLPTADLFYSEGVISLTYLYGTEKCHKKYNRSTVIKFTCDHESSGVKGPIFITEADDCTYIFKWPTRHACPPFDTVDCSAEDNAGFQYDLSALSLSNDNYYVKHPMSENQTFVINICRSVVHSADSLCPYKSASCLLVPDYLLSVERALNLGEVASSPYFADGNLKIKYTSGDICTDIRGVSARFMETIIEFICDKGNTISEPEFIGKDRCTFYFTWHTAFACAINTTESSDDCAVNDPITDFRFDLSPLKRDLPYVVKASNHEFFLNVCDPLKKIENLKNSSCNSGSGLCQAELTGSQRKWNAGNSNANLQYRNGLLFLNYSGGDSCHNNEFNRSSIIQFDCGKEIGEPKFVYESDDCTYYFVWQTELACQPLVPCGVKSGNSFFDLYPLAQNSYYIAESQLVNDDSFYYISVCHAFSKLPNPLCPPHSSVCQVNHPETAAESLGRVEHPPFVDFEGHATILYTNGSVCAPDPSQRNRARIIFLCDPSASLGNPILIDISDDCLYIFEWKSSIVCPPEPALPKNECRYVDRSKGVFFDLMPLSKNASYYEVPGNVPSENFILNFCGSTSIKDCGTSAICRKYQNLNDNYGTSSSMTFSYDGLRLRAVYTDGDECLFSESGKRASEILFICDPNAGVGKPTLSKKYSCLVIFNWATSFVCQNTRHSCSFDVLGRHYDFHLLSSLSHTWQVNDTQGNTYLMNLCRELHQDDTTSQCPLTSAVCRIDGVGSYSSLGVINTMSAKMTDAGELMLSYSMGSSVPCMSLISKASTTSLNATARIFFSCGNSLGTPTWRSGPSPTCVFDFEWKTSLACDDTVEEVTMGNNSILIDEKFQFKMNFSDIMNRTFNVSGISTTDHYVYVINLGLGYAAIEENDKDCATAAVCQTKPNAPFHRDIGSLGSMKFIFRGSQLHLLLTSYTKPCGKLTNRNVTTIINMECSSFAGIGSPTFLYESGGCDYMFNWKTHAVCPKFDRPKVDSNDEDPVVSNNTDGHQKGNNDTLPNNDEHKNGNIDGNLPSIEHQEGNGGSSNNAVKIVVTFIAIALIVCLVIFVFANARRRSAVALKCRSLFNRVHLPRFRYRRGDMLTELQSDF